MGFPDRIERTVDLPHDVGRVWAALTTDEGLRAWFGQEAIIQLYPGGAAQLRCTDGRMLYLRVERVEAPTVFAFTWRIHGLPEDDPRRTYVEFTLDPVEAGTRLRVVETGFGQLPDDVYREGYEAHTNGWATELDELADYLNAS